MAEVTIERLDKLIGRNDTARAARDAGDDAAVLAALNAKTVKQTNNTLRTANWLMLEFDAVVDPATGATEADVILGTLQASTVPRVIAAVAALSNNGIDVSNPQVQDMIPAMEAGAAAAGAAWPDGLAERLMKRGVWYITPGEDKFQTPGLVLTAQQIADWRAWYDLTRRVKDNYAATLEGISTGTITDWAEASAALTA